MFAAATGLFLLGYYWGNLYQRPELSEVETAILLRPPLPLPEFHATDSSGRPLGIERLNGQWHLLLVGASDEPATRRGLAQLSRIHNRLGEHPAVQEALRPLLLSPDPERDTEERLLDTIQAYNPAMVAAHGTKTELQELLEALGIPSTTEETGPQRPVALYLLDPQVRLAALFTADQHPAAVAHDLRLIVEAARET